MTSYINGSTVFINDFDNDVDELMLDLIEVIKHKAVKAGASDKEGTQHIEFWVNSLGGDSERAFGLVALMEWAKSLGVRINTVVLSEASSSGSLVAISGSPGYRRVAPGSMYMIHYGEVDFGARSPVELTRMHDAYQHHFERILAHYKKYCNVPKLKSKIGSDYFHVTAEQAIEWGLADGYL